MPPKAVAKYVDTLQAEGRYTFHRNEASHALRINGSTFARAAARLSAKGRILALRRGFYVIVPIEYRAMGAPPPPWYIDEFMRYLGRPYYVGVLSAAALYGAAHEQPQEFQVVTGVPQRPMLAGRARIRFLAKKHYERIPTAKLKTEAGFMLVSTPEATAIDLLRYVSAAGGLGSVATVLAELAERIDGRKLVEAARIDGELAYSQRLGYILERIGAGDRAAALAQWIESRKPRNTPLRPGKSIRGRPVDRRFGVIVNEDIETEK
jgi:predicted transcriptional regulator of viral defense system